jgi:branched-chain amino acid transport system substrate-binding protein
MFKRKSKILSIAFLTVFIVSILLVIPSCQKKEDVIKIGAILPLTGNLAFIGVPEKRGLEIAVEEINQKGGINDQRLEIIFHDSKGSPKEGVTVANKLINTENVKIIIGSTTGVNKAIAPLSEKYNVLLFSQSMDQSIPKASKFIFSIYPSLENQAATISEYIRKKGYKKLAALCLNDVSMAEQINLIEENLDEYSIHITTKETYEITGREFRSKIRKIKNYNTDALLLFGYGSLYPTIFKQLSEMKYDKPVIGNPAFLFSSATEKGTDIYKNAVFASFPRTLNDYKMENFARRYREKYNEEMPRYIDPIYFYDVVNIIAQAVGKVGSSPNNIADYIAGLDNYSGLSGNIKIFKDGTSKVPLKMAQYKNGEVEFVE